MRTVVRNLVESHLPEDQQHVRKVEGKWGVEVPDGMWADVQSVLGVVQRGAVDRPAAHSATAAAVQPAGAGAEPAIRARPGAMAES